MYPSPGAYEPPSVTPGAIPVSRLSMSELDSHSTSRPELVLQRDALVGLGDFGFGEARHQIALCDEPAVQRVTIAGGGVEGLAAKTQPDGRLGAALRANHARGAAAGAVTEGAGLEQHDVAGAAFGELNRRPGSDRAAADDHDVAHSCCWSYPKTVT